jgi:hypothetical protein
VAVEELGAWADALDGCSLGDELELRIGNLSDVATAAKVGDPYEHALDGLAVGQRVARPQGRSSASKDVGLLVLRHERLLCCEGPRRSPAWIGQTVRSSPR